MTICRQNAINLMFPRLVNPTVNEPEPEEDEDEEVWVSCGRCGGSGDDGYGVCTRCDGAGGWWE